MLRNLQYQQSMVPCICNSFLILCTSKIFWISPLPHISFQAIRQHSKFTLPSERVQRPHSLAVVEASSKYYLCVQASMQFTNAKNKFVLVMRKTICYTPAFFWFEFHVIALGYTSWFLFMPLLETELFSHGSDCSHHRENWCIFWSIFQGSLSNNFCPVKGRSQLYLTFQYIYFASKSHLSPSHT